jgi:four helix bundle protein
MRETHLKERTKNFAKQVISLCRQPPNNREGRLIGNQLFRSGTSVAANYRGACRGRSKAEFISKLAIVEEEADETRFWFEIVKEMKILRLPSIDLKLQESDEIISMVVSSIKTMRKAI